MRKIVRKIPATTAETEFGEEGFVESVWTTMMEQERLNPAIALLHEKMSGNFLLIGLTGGIASGKSTIARFLRDAGIPVVDADEIARDVVQPSQKAYHDIVDRFGPQILQGDGTLNRARLANIVFSDTGARKDLENITHPAILTEIARRVRKLRSQEENSGIIIVDAALLFESGLSRVMDKNILIRVSPELQIQRLTARDGISVPDAEQRIRSQFPNVDKENLADFVIDNSGSLEEAQRQMAGILQAIVSGAESDDDQR